MLFCAFVFAAVKERLARPVLFVLNDADEAGYFYHDLVQILGQDQAFFFPSTYRRAVKYGQKDAANEILRTEVLARLASSQPLYVVTYPDALAEMVVSKKNLDERIIKLAVGDQVSLMDISHQLRDFDFMETDYVYEPGQFAIRGSILDIYSYSCEFPFRIDFFGDEIDTIRTFSIEDQLSRDRRESVEIVPELSLAEGEKLPFLHFLDKQAVVAMKDFTFVYDRIDQIYKEGFSSQSMVEQMEGATEVEAERIRRAMKKELNLSSALQFQQGVAERQRIEFGIAEQGVAERKTEEAADVVPFHIVPQPLFHKNFDLIGQMMEDYLLQQYTLYILADSSKQQQRLKDILRVRN